MSGSSGGTASGSAGGSWKDGKWYGPESGRCADPDAIIDRITRELARVDVDGEELEKYQEKKWDWDDSSHRLYVRQEFGDDRDGEAILPGFGPDGHGENAREDCGNPHPFVCDCCGQTVEFGRTCGMSVCGRCAQVWCRDAGIRKAAKVRRVRKVQNYAMPDSVLAKIHHLVISPSLGWYYRLAKAGYTREEAQELTRKVVKDVLDELRAQGVLVRHSFRGAHRDGSIKAEKNDKGAWKERVFSDREWYGDVREQLAWKPHYHAIGVSNWIEVKGDGEDPGLAERVEDATGWVIHRIEDDDGISLSSDGAMAGALTYCLSHADIFVRDDAANRSAVWEVGTFEDDIIRSDSRFSPRPHDLQWADRVVRRKAWRILGINNGTTDCGANIPDVDDPDELAIKILEKLYPDVDERPDVPTDVVLDHVAEGNISVAVSGSSGGGGRIRVRDAFGEPVRSSGWGRSSLPTPSSSISRTAGNVDRVATSIVKNKPNLSEDAGREDQEADVDDDHDGDRADRDGLITFGGDKCDGTLTPLGEIRKRGLLEDPDWCRDAVHVEQARKADLEWPEELENWYNESPGSASPAIG